MTTMDKDVKNATEPAQPAAMDPQRSDESMRELASRAVGAHAPELMAPGHLYNPRTGTGIEWLSEGKARLWTRQWNGQPVVLFESAHNMQSPWEYWYNLEFARSFPHVTHWWFGDAWTGQMRIWRPEVVEDDPESHQPMLTGWMRFGRVDSADSSESADAQEAQEAQEAPGSRGIQDTFAASGRPDPPALPWTVVLTNPVRVNVPFPPLHANIKNLPLQLLLGEKVMELLEALTERAIYAGEIGDSRELDLEISVTSLVRREDLYRAFPCALRSWCLDRLPGMTPREALCRVQGLEADSVPALS